MSIAIWIKVILALIPLMAELVALIRANRIKQEALKEIGDVLQLEARRLAHAASVARDSVDHSADSVQNDPYNRD